VKTRLQTEGVHSGRKLYSPSVSGTLAKIAREEGGAALWRGLQPRVLFHVPAAAVSWGTYETIKSLLLGPEAPPRPPHPPPMPLH